MDSDARERLVCVAAVTGAHGVRGAFRLRCFTQAPESVAEWGCLLDEKGRPLFEVRPVAAAKGGMIVAAAGIEDRDAAEALKGLKLHIPRSRLPETEDDEFYIDDLVGLAVRDETEAVIGRVRAVFDHGAGEVVEIALDEGGTLDLPFTRAFVPEIDLEAGMIGIVRPVMLGDEPRGGRAR